MVVVILKDIVYVSFEEFKRSEIIKVLAQTATNVFFSRPKSVALFHFTMSKWLEEKSKTVD